MEGRGIAKEADFVADVEVSSNPKVMAAALVSGPHTKIYIRIVPTTANLDFLGSYQLPHILKPII